MPLIYLLKNVIHIFQLLENSHWVLYNMCEKGSWNTNITKYRLIGKKELNMQNKKIAFSNYNRNKYPYHLALFRTIIENHVNSYWSL